MIYNLVHNNLQKLLVIRCLSIKVIEMNTMKPSDNANTTMISGDPCVDWNIKKIPRATNKLKIVGKASSFFFLWSFFTLARICSWKVVFASLIVFFSWCFSISGVASFFCKSDIKSIATRLIAHNRKKFTCHRSIPIITGCITKK